MLRCNVSRWVIWVGNLTPVLRRVTTEMWVVGSQRASERGGQRRRDDNRAHVGRNPGLWTNAHVSLCQPRWSDVYGKTNIWGNVWKVTSVLTFLNAARGTEGPGVFMLAFMFSRGVALRPGRTVAALFKVLKIRCARQSNLIWLCRSRQHSGSK